MVTDLFLRRFREGISFPNFMERSILKLPLSNLCAVPFSLQNRVPFAEQKKGEKVPRKGRKRGGQRRGKKEERTRENRSGNLSESMFISDRMVAAKYGPSSSPPTKWHYLGTAHLDLLWNASWVQALMFLIFFSFS